jgi:hypothetical protein
LAAKAPRRIRYELLIGKRRKMGQKTLNETNPKKLKARQHRV